MAHDGTSTKEQQLPSNLRLLLILEEVARLGRSVKPMEIGEILGLPKPTIHRLFQTAEAEGFLQRDLDGRSYAPGHRMRKLAVNTMSSEHIRTARLTILKAVAEKIGETCNLATPDREGMTYLDRVETKWPLRIQLPVGTQVPFHCTASGKMYLSSLRASTLKGFIASADLSAETRHTITDPEALNTELQDTRKRRYSTDNEEFMLDMVAIAVPVLDHSHRLVATLSVHAPTQRYSTEGLIEFLPDLQDASRRLSNLLHE